MQCLSGVVGVSVPSPQEQISAKEAEAGEASTLLHMVMSPCEASVHSASGADTGRAAHGGRASVLASGC